MSRVVLLWLVASPAFAADHYVGPNETHTTLQQALGAARDGDRILVSAGVYEECLRIQDTALEFIALGDVTWRGCGYGPNLLTTNVDEREDVDRIRIVGFDLESLAGHQIYTGSAPIELIDSDLFGGSVLANQGGQVYTETGFYAENSTFAGPAFAGSGGLVFAELRAEVHDSLMWGGEAAKSGGALAVGPLAPVWIEGSTFQDNVATDGGAVFATDGRVYDSLFVDNAASRTGAHLSDVGVISGSTFRHGTASQGVAVDSRRLRLVIDSRFEDNAYIRADASGLEEVQFIRNTHCLTTPQAAIQFVSSGSRAVIYNTQFSGPGQLWVGSGSGTLAVYHSYAASGVGPIFYSANEFNQVYEANVFDVDGPVFEFANAGLAFNNWFSQTGSPHVLGYTIDPTNRQGVATGLVGDPCQGGLSYEGRPAVMNTITDYARPLSGYDWAATDWDDSLADAGPFGGFLADPDLYVDGDGDGWPAVLDCNDADDTIAPLKPELCDAIDQDCDPATAAAGGVTYYRDTDGDGFGDRDDPGQVTCTPVSDQVANNLDCDDSNPRVWPWVYDRCDGLDNDCDGTIDNSKADDWYRDGDGDGAGDITPNATCTPQSDEVAQPNDCDDGTFGMTYRYAIVGYYDGDRDGAVSAYPDGSIRAICDQVLADCDDNNFMVMPGAADTCDGIDSDCDGLVDEDDVSTTSGFIDGDGDGIGDVAYSGCDGRLDVVRDGGDCDDANPLVFPGRTDVCNGFDDDCDGTADNGPSPTWWVDTDGDDAWVEGPTQCDPPPTGWLYEPTMELDCNDSSDLQYPSNPEQCGDGIDNDCDGTIDEDPTGVPWWEDADQDGYTVELPVFLCAGVTPSGNWSPTTTSAWDCDDADPTIFPGQPEACDSIDNDCDTSIDEDGGPEAFADLDSDGLGGVSLGHFCTLPNGAVTSGGDCDDSDDTIGAGPEYYRDADSDGFGGTEVIASCTNPGPGYTATPGDCVDSDATAFPGAEEVCNNRDDDCDGTLDEGLPTQAYFGDADGDGWGGALIQACGPGAAVSGLSGDCDDADPTVHPSAFDLCEDGIDANCDGTDPECNPADSDGDGFCEGGCTEAGDCNDTDPNIGPYSAEACNQIDDDCDGLIDDGLTSDHDGDSFTSDGSCAGSADDCNDWIDSIFVGASEACNGMDDDCDDLTDEGIVVDADGDGFPAPGDCLTFAPVDCDDSDPNVYPGATETDNGTDDDCDGIVDEPSAADDADGDGFCEGPTCDDPNVLPGDCDDTDPAINPGLGTIDIDDGIDNDCDGTIDGGPSRNADRDRDGFTVAQGDCNDLNPQIHPGAVEQCNGLDDDCDGLVAVSEFDIDGDGLRACQGDCDDFNARVRPGIAEDCADSLDNNCDGRVNEDADADGDGFTTCMGDCRDDLPQINPAAPEEACNEIDDNCDGVIDEGLDRDGDGWIACVVVLDDGCIPDQPVCDCDDTNRFVAPYLPEICGDGLDNNCDGAIDNDEDLDGDGWTTCEGDCRDDDPFRSPGAPELCDDIDNDCDFRLDEGFDTDGDGWRTCAGDCDDTSADSFPLAEELCDTQDNDCNGVVDDPWPDLDLDGYSECDPTPDCDEGNATVSPDAAEDCTNGIDDDCDGAVDWDDSQCDASAYPEYCGCAASPAPAAWWLVPTLVAVMRRRRR